MHWLMWCRHGSESSAKGRRHDSRARLACPLGNHLYVLRHHVVDDVPAEFGPPRTSAVGSIPLVALGAVPSSDRSRHAGAHYRDNQPGVDCAGDSHDSHPFGNRALAGKPAQAGAAGMTWLVKLAAGIWSAITRALGAFGDWIGGDRDWWTIGWATAAACCGIWASVLTAQLNKARMELIVSEAGRVTAETGQAAAVAARRAAEADYANLQQTMRERDEQVAADIRNKTAEIERMRAANVEQAAQLASAQAKAEASNAGWWKVYNNRSQTCRAALEALDTACAELGTK